MPEERPTTEVSAEQLTGSPPDHTGPAALSSFQAMRLAQVARRAGDGDAEALRLLPTMARFLEAAALEGFAGRGIMPRGRRVADVWPGLAAEI